MKLIQFIVFCVAARLTSSAVSDLSTIHITSTNSHICSENSPFSSVGNFSACFFTKVSSSEGVIFSVRDISNNETFLIRHSEERLILQFNNQTKNVSRKIHTSRWTHICVKLQDAKDVEVHVNYIVERWTFDESSESEDSEKEVISNSENRNENDTSFIQVCIGDSEETEASFIGEISGLYLITVNETLIKRDFECLYYNNVEFEDFKKWQSFGTVRNISKSTFEVCLDTVQILIQDTFVSYDEHLSTCKSLRGRLLRAEEILLLSDTIHSSSLINCRRRNKNTWVESDINMADTLDNQCSVFDEIEIKEQSCIIEAYCNVCVFPYYLEMKLYGLVSKFDRNYVLLLSKENNIDIITGSNSSEIDHAKPNEWILKSYLHNDRWTITDQALPLGRKNWTNIDNDEKLVLALTACSDDDFTCNDGTCLSFSKRCDTEVDCVDASDEHYCQHIQTKTGYDIKKIPYSLDGSGRTTIKFFTRIYNIRDISPNDGKITLNILFIFFWQDPRLIIWNPDVDKEVDCNSIWSPAVTMVSSQMIVDHEQYRSSCKIRNYPRENAPSLTKSLKHPYMGRYSDGKNETLSYWYAGMVTIYCKQNLRKYPFGRQTCPLEVFSDHNAMLSDDYKFVPSYHQEQYEDNEVLYSGEKELGEYYLNKIHYELIRRDMKIKILIELESLSGFHMLNSYTPSFLICFIAYGTFLLPLSNFNERIMVSLTVLLVLATLFTQASGSSVKTPYFKNLDIWFVALLIFCFLVVMVNIVIQLFYEREARTPYLEQEKSEDKSDDDFIHSDKNRPLKWGTAKIMNVLAIIIFASFFMLFVTIYFLKAAEVI